MLIMNVFFCLLFSELERKLNVKKVPDLSQIDIKRGMRTRINLKRETDIRVKKKRESDVAARQMRKQRRGNGTPVAGMRKKRRKKRSQKKSERKKGIKVEVKKSQKRNDQVKEIDLPER